MSEPKEKQKPAAKWKDFKKEMQQKRLKQGKITRGVSETKVQELIVQQLTSKVSGKAQKFNRIGPREFVAFPQEHLTIPFIKDACLEHFRERIGEGMTCDVLASEQGPSCHSLDQIPNKKLIHTRFLKK